MEKLKIEFGDKKAIKNYLSKNRSIYGIPIKELGLKTKNGTIFCNTHNTFLMSDGNSIYELNFPSQ